MVAEVVNQDDLFEELLRRPVDNAVDRSDKRAPSLVCENDHDTRRREVIVVRFLPATAIGKTETVRASCKRKKKLLDK